MDSKMKKKEIEEVFGGILEKEQDVSAGMAAIRTLLTVLEHDTSETVQELDSNLQAAVDAMKNTDYPVTAVASGCELFLRFITLAKLDTKTFGECKSIMLHRGQLFLKKLMEARGKVAKLASSFIVDGSRVLIHSKSRVVLHAMKEAARANKRFEVYVTMSSPDNSGLEMCRLLEEENIPCTVILDSAVGYVMEQVDMVMAGAEGVVESGGIINKVGSYTMAICAREMKKPFYVLTESFKFVRLYPLNQRDLPNEFKYTSSKLGKDLTKEHPLVDYTPPSYITLLFTDLGILTPSAVSDELIKLYL
ncbi:Translation initiation factor eIF-2B subunit alpha [Cryptotermes secundus]|uniref:Translation initiation factor eIF2B subunit alpha n=1 Tax=Cryptotermes secundus TaxID=105785 RepID=A0A2J7Q3Q7_9NEOP|nr:translation initiation factor eIF-2B subunit alpha [Cryptotermes secundus]XP_033609546.1 translation initiation factor eIF-2B subunit alpha [Cryptotermes secundus]PNF23221.1 Translation initiation factor eIF-2B subunit alpha [Cryptotermes secundus]PNF23224.1 Translation initiation factor eIF-2B subunit alpha [Cryptotermes secundus]